MATSKQIEANRANARRSTGPATTEGKARSAKNSMGHGLHAKPETCFQQNPEHEEAYNALARKLRQDCQPNSELEEITFARYAWATFQSQRARVLEAHTEARWLEDPDNSKRFATMERTIKLAALHERRADKALRELRQLQKDRFAAYEVDAELCVMGQELRIPRSFPTTELRKSNLQKTNPNYLAQKPSEAQQNLKTESPHPASDHMRGQANNQQSHCQAPQTPSDPASPPDSL
ncbi:hypothetical protein [Bryobacter aggregatus]|uniref:hypothetical protein n=1 Tax=Bryobacter aggregatus TaxID=360054 RepID=UPI0004E1BF3D|nr:hypothetical protein [Bryobacter aggregatus]